MMIIVYEEDAHINCEVFGRPGMKPTIYRTQLNHYTTQTIANIYEITQTQYR